SYDHAIIGLDRPSYGAVSCRSSERSEIDRLRAARPQCSTRNRVSGVVGSPCNPTTIIDAVSCATQSAKRRQWNYFVHNLRRLRNDPNRFNYDRCQQSYPGNACRHSESHVASLLVPCLSRGTEIPASALHCTVADAEFSQERTNRIRRNPRTPRTIER